MLDTFIFLLFTILGFALPKWIRIDIKWRRQCYYIWIYHIVFSLIYYLLIYNDTSSDAMRFWKSSQLLDNQTFLKAVFMGKGTYFMYGITYPLSVILKLKFITASFIYCFIGFLGIIIYIKLSLDYVYYNSKIFNISLFPLVFYLPNLHFWSSTLGKDTLSFTCIAIFIYAMTNIRKYIIWLLVSLLLCYLVRPHIALFLLLSFSLASLFNREIPVYRRVFISAVLILGSFFLIPKVLEFVKIDEFSIDSYVSYSEHKAKNLSDSHTSSSVDTSSYPFILKVFTFLYRPTFTDINGVAALIAAFENLFLLLLSIHVFFKDKFLSLKNAPYIIKSMVLFIIIGVVVFSYSLGNLGIMLRMRNMFLPSILITFLWILSYRLSLLKNPN